MTPLLILVVGPRGDAIGTDILLRSDHERPSAAWQHLKKYTVHLGLRRLASPVGSVPRRGLAGVKVIEVLQSNYGDGRVNKIRARHGGRRSSGRSRGDAHPVALPFRRVIPDRAAMHLLPQRQIIAFITGAITGFIIGLTSAGSGPYRDRPHRRVPPHPQRSFGPTSSRRGSPPGRRNRQLVGSNIDFCPRRETSSSATIPGVLIGPTTRPGAAERHFGTSLHRWAHRIGARVADQAEAAGGGPHPPVGRLRWPGAMIPACSSSR